jgi:hypothetical protein
MADHATIHAEDLLPVRSRVSWGAIFAGATVALALYFLLTLVGSAIGLSVAGHVRPSNVGVGAAIWAILSTVAALFVGGWVTTQLAVGENKTEAVMHGVILWGVLFAMLLWLMASGIKAGFSAMMGMAQTGAVVARGTTAEDWQAAARRGGVPEETVAEWKRKAADAPEAARREAADPENQQAAEDAATRVTWWAVLGTLLSMAAAVFGALAGSGPTLRLFAVRAPLHRPAFERPQPAGRM